MSVVDASRVVKPGIPRLYGTFRLSPEVVRGTPGVGGAVPERRRYPAAAAGFASSEGTGGFRIWSTIRVS
jgi:hypothetical protein